MQAAHRSGDGTALGMLAEKGFVRRVPGRGTFAQKTSSTAENTEKDPADQNRIGVILEHIATPYGLSLLYEMDQAAEATGYKLCVRFSYGDREKEKEEIRFLISLSVQGLIVKPWQALQSRHSETLPGPVSHGADR